MERDEADRLHEGLRRSFAEVCRRVEGARLEERVGYRLVVCPQIPFPGFNGIWADGPDESAAVRELERAIEAADKQGLPFWVEARAGRTPAIERAARGLGLTHEDAIPGMVVRHDELAIVSGPELEITRVEDEAELAVATSVVAAGFEARRGPFAALLNPRVAALPGLSIYVARAGGRPVSTALAWIGDGSIGIFNVATPPEYRGRGYGRAVTEKAVIEGFAAGADLAWLQASPLGEPVYRAMGFRHVEMYLVLGRPTAN